MSLFNEDFQMAGVTTEIISDYNSGYDTSLFGTTESVVIIGTAFNGPVGVPVAIYSPEHARYVFGPVYDSKTKKEATLVANIKDAWDAGSRTIYAVRMSGELIYKDFQLAIDSNLRLRVSGMFPSNIYKEVSMLFNNNDHEMSIKLFKPADRATIQEKRQGMVNSKDSILVNSIDLFNSGITKNDDLVSLIRLVNDNPYNNVLRLSVVDQEGNDVTDVSMEAKFLKVGDIFPGLYLIGRDKNGQSVTPDTQLSLKLEGKPYESFTGGIYKILVLNTDISTNLPIYSSKGKDILSANLGIPMIEEFDFLSVPGKIDSIFLKDVKDYEQVDLSHFDKYRKLGSGYAVTAHVVVDETGKKAKVKETVDPALKILEIKDGVYSMLENLQARYRVLASVPADAKIQGKLPKADEFKISTPVSKDLFNGALQIKTNVNSKDLTAAKEYELKFETLSDLDIDEILAAKESILDNVTAKEVTAITRAEMDSNDKEYKDGSLFLCTDDLTDTEEITTIRLYSFNNKKFVSMHKPIMPMKPDTLKGSFVMANGALYVCAEEIIVGAIRENVFRIVTEADLKGKKAVIATLANGAFVLVSVDGTDGTCKVLGTVSQVLKTNKDEDIILTALQDSYNSNKIVIKGNGYDFLTLDELAGLLNEDKDFASLFTVNTIDITKAQDYVEDVLGVEVYALADREIAYDTNLYIPFRTDDNFARHFAQHCMYTSLKTGPTHGFMGVSTLQNINLTSVAKRASELAELRLESLLVAKKGNGTHILDANNMPYPIGRKVSVTVGQYLVQTEDNYTCLSNMASGYAGMVSKLPLDQSSTCQKINIPNLMYEFTNYQLGILTASGFVTAKKSSDLSSWVITDGVTMAPSGSSYRRLSASRIADGVEQVIRNVCERFIGKQNSLQNQNSLRSALKSDIDKLKNTLLEAYEFKLIVDKESQRMGVINVDYAIVAINEIKEIRNRVTSRE